MTSLLYNLLILGSTLGLFFRYREKIKQHLLGPKELDLFFYLGSLGLFWALLLPGDAFAKMQYLCWFIFIHVPIALLLFTWRCESRFRIVRSSVLGLAGLILLVGFDAFFYEPLALQVTQHTIVSDKIDQPVTIALLADIQTDKPGDYEKKVLSLTKQHTPDLILFAGDYLQIADKDTFSRETKTLNQILKQAKLSPPLGNYAVQGNIDYQAGWSNIFKDTNVTLEIETGTHDLGPLALTCLSMTDSSQTSTTVPAQDTFHIILGHVPNYALSDIQADLLLAGHTHGGQVRLPFIGPLLTFSAIPRQWADRATEIAPGKTLIVSRGVGMERDHAPRLRFLCRPELVIIHLVPAD